MQLIDVCYSDPLADVSSVNHFGCVVFERGEHSLAEFLKSNRRLHHMMKVGIFHQMLQAVHFLHNEKDMVHCDLKPQNLVLFTSSNTWKLIDMATCCEEDDEAPIHFSLRYVKCDFPRVYNHICTTCSRLVCAYLATSYD
jgi:serine/threonine protein kinase